MSNREIISSTYEKHGGIFRLIPIFVPRPFSTPGRRLRRHPDAGARHDRGSCVRAAGHAQALRPQPSRKAVKKPKI